MKIDGKPYRTIWIDPDDPAVVRAIDQRDLPHRFVIEPLRTVAEVATAIRDMHVRGAGLIGAAAGYGLYLGAVTAPPGADLREHLPRCAAELIETRPTAVNLAWAVRRQLAALDPRAERAAQVATARAVADAIADEDADACRRIGEHGLPILERIAAAKAGRPVEVLTHCNAGWLAFVDHGSATAPIYAAFDRGVPVHVWVDETRPWSQGARLTAWELGQHGVPHTVIPDNAGGHLMQHGRVDLVITGSDRTTFTGDAANKIGTYLKALAAHDNGVPFYVALPSSTFDWEIEDGVRDIPIEERAGREVSHARGWLDGRMVEVQLTPAGSPTANFGFDVTPRRLITGLITERGVCRADRDSVLALFPERRRR
jgi:methylthioribose-1-phosphate isomerase